MNFRLYFIYVFAITSFTNAVKVNMHGSLNLGKEVMESITHYLRNGYSNLLSGRRSLNADLDHITLEVKTASVCADLQFCNSNLERFLNDYIIELTQTFEGVFEGIVNPEDTSDKETPYFGDLKGFLNNARKVLQMANKKVTEDRESYLWVGVIKKISGIFQQKTVTYIVDRLEADPKEIKAIKKRLVQSMVIGIAVVEDRAQKRLCEEFHICSNSNECTTALNTLLGRLTRLANIKIMGFMKAFSKNLEGYTLYSKLDSETAQRFQTILNDMSYSEDVPVKQILSSLQEIVETRLNTIHASIDMTKGSDVQLVHVILSDLDYLYSKHKSETLRDILDDIAEWAKNGGKIASYVKDAMRSLDHVISSGSDEIVMKLIYEVRVFLETTIDK